MRLSGSPGEILSGSGSIFTGSVLAFEPAAEVDSDFAFESDLFDSAPPAGPTLHSQATAKMHAQFCDRTVMPLSLI
jgi:hypothetical protein